VALRPLSKPDACQGEHAGEAANEQGQPLDQRLVELATSVYNTHSIMAKRRDSRPAPGMPDASFSF